MTKSLQLVSVKKSSKKRAPANNLTSAVYRGPIVMRQNAQADDTVTIPMGYGGSISASAGGTVNSVLGSYAQLTSVADWASLQNIYSEYRILAMKSTFHPWNKYNVPTTSTVVPVWSVVDRGDATALASVGATAAIGSAELHDPCTAFTREIRMDSLEEGQFLPIANAPAAGEQFYIKLYSSGNTASINLYDYQTILIVQFRGRK